MYHLSMQEPIKRRGKDGPGRSTTAAAAYRSGSRIVDERTGLEHDYRRKGGVLSARLYLPAAADGSRMTPIEGRAGMWNRLEQHHKRGDAVTGREIILGLPAQLDRRQREQLAEGYAQELSDRYGVMVDVALHEPSDEGDQRNWHAHVLMSACHVEPDGTMGKKCVELDPIHCARHGLPVAADVERPRWQDLCNAALDAAGSAKRVDHRTLAAQGIDRPPSTHLGPGAVAHERRTRTKSRRRLDHERVAAEREQARAEAAAAAAERAALDDAMIELCAASDEVQSVKAAQREDVALRSKIRLGISEGILGALRLRREMIEREAQARAQAQAEAKAKAADQAKAKAAALAKLEAASKPAPAPAAKAPVQRPKHTYHPPPKWGDEDPPEEGEQRYERPRMR